MTPAETGTLLAKCAAFDARTVGRADVLAWHEVIGDYELADALAAVTAWYTTHRDRIMPSDLRELVLDRIRERRKAGRESAERRAIEAYEGGPLADHGAEIQAFVDQVRDVLPAGEPDSLRWGHRHWRQLRQYRERTERYGPNPLYDPAVAARLAAENEADAHPPVAEGA